MLESTANHEISGRVVQAYADENGLFFWETSAKSNINVNEVFVDIAKRLPKAAAVSQVRDYLFDTLRYAKSIFLRKLHPRVLD